MSDIEFNFIGWCKEDGHDKVWTTFKAAGRWYAAWGRRGKRLSFKDHGVAISGFTPWKLEKLKGDKMRGKNDGSSRYKEVDAFMLFTVFPDFEEVVHKELFFRTMAGQIR